ncbi:MAG: LPS-assembly protein LptD [Holosporales bacterium]
MSEGKTMLTVIFFIMFAFYGFSEDLLIYADEMRYNDKTKKSTAIGNARAEFKKKQYMLTAHEFSMTRSDVKGEDYANIDAKGSVFLKTQNYEINADQCMYEKQAEKITCTGNVSLHDLKKGNRINGHEAIFDIQQENYSMKGSCSKKTETILKIK